MTGGDIKTELTISSFPVNSSSYRLYSKLKLTTNHTEELFSYAAIKSRRKLNEVNVEDLIQLEKEIDPQGLMSSKEFLKKISLSKFKRTQHFLLRYFPKRA